MRTRFQAYAALLAAGQGSRLAQATGGVAKQFLSWHGKPLYWHSLETFSRVPGISGVILAFSPDEFERASQEFASLKERFEFEFPVQLVKGGARRQDSVFNCLEVLPRECTHVLVHDAARPFCSAKLVFAVLEALREGAAGVIPGVPVKDTIKSVNAGLVGATLRREELLAVQTPQGFALEALRAGFAKALREGLSVTDDASLLEALGLEVVVLPGEESNLKITTPEDLRHIEAEEEAMKYLPVTGFGYDVHRYAAPGDDPLKRRPLKLGAEPVEEGGYEVLAHSDGDVLIHALCDALLGCMAEGDIGGLFPDTDERFAGIESSVLLNEVLLKFRAAGLKLCHADLTIVAQVPKIAPKRERIRKNLAALLGLELSALNVKATTEERLGFTGEKRGIKAYAVVSALKPLT